MKKKTLSPIPDERRTSNNPLNPNLLFAKLRARVSRWCSDFSECSNSQMLFISIYLTNREQRLQNTWRLCGPTAETTQADATELAPNAEHRQTFQSFSTFVLKDLEAPRGARSSCKTHLFVAKRNL